MLVIIGDMHLSDNSLSREPVNRDMAKFFRHNMSRIMQEKKLFERAKPLELCLIGDCLDILRSDVWCRNDVETRPWMPPSKEQESVVLEIIQKTIDSNRHVFDEFKKLLNSYNSRLIYVIGNHDKLVSTYKEARKLIVEAFGMTDSKVTFCDEHTWEEYHVHAFHGHRSDFRNNDDPYPSIGTMAYVEIFNRLPYELGKHVDRESRAYRRTVALDSINLSHVGLWFDGILNELEDDKLYRKVFKRVVRHFFARKEMKIWKHLKLFSKDWISAWLFKASLVLLSILPYWACRVIARFSTFIFEGFSIEQALIAQARKELELNKGNNIRYIVSGHTHAFTRIPLGDLDGKPTYYLNSGAWGRTYERSVSRKDKGHFSPEDSLSYIVFYKEDENSRFSFEVWNGSLGPKI